MKIVEPKIWKVAETKLNNDEVKEWLQYLGGEECLSHVTGNDGEKLIELAGRRCYKSFKPGLNPNVSKIRKESAEYHKNTLSTYHGSIDEHTSVTFAIEGLSRVICMELIRHRAGTAFSQESLRYVRLNDIEIWIPQIFSEFGLEAEEKAHQIFKETVEVCEKAQNKLCDLFGIEGMNKFDLKKKL